MSARYERVKKYYESGLWSLEQVKMAVARNWITATEFKQITGKKY